MGWKPEFPFYLPKFKFMRDLQGLFKIELVIKNKQTKKMKGVYQIKNISNDRKYIGSLKTIKKRWEIHRRKLNAGVHSNSYL